MKAWRHIGLRQKEKLPTLWNRIPKLVFSKTLKLADWNNTILISENATDEIRSQSESGWHRARRGGPRPVGRGGRSSEAGRASRSAIRHARAASGRGARHAPAVSGGSRGFDQVLALAPSNLSSIHGKALSFLGEGDLNSRPRGGSRRVGSRRPHRAGRVLRDLLRPGLGAGPETARPAPSPHAQLVRRRSGDLGALSDAGVCAQRRRVQRRRYADDARATYEEQLREMPNNGQQHVLLGLSLAYLGRKDEAIREGLRGVELVPLSKESVGGPYRTYSPGSTRSSASRRRRSTSSSRS